VEKHNVIYLVMGVVGIYLVFMHLVYAFPLLARYENGIVNTLRNSYSIAAKFLGRTIFLAVLLAVEVGLFLWNTTTQFIGFLIGPACVILTISGFARSFFTIIERENQMEKVEFPEEDCEDND
jgi:uncharacterized membrane protein YesL